jgi:hypothetical protein
VKAGRQETTMSESELRVKLREAGYSGLEQIEVRSDHFTICFPDSFQNPQKHMDAMTALGFEVIGAAMKTERGRDGRIQAYSLVGVK